MAGSVGVTGVVPGLINLRQAQKLPGDLNRANLGDFPDPQRRTPGPWARHIEVEIHFLGLLSFRLGRGCLGSASHSRYLAYDEVWARLILLHGAVDLIRPRQDAAFEVFDALITGLLQYLIGLCT